MNRTLFYLMTLTPGLGCFSAQAMQRADAKRRVQDRMEDKYAQDSFEQRHADFREWRVSMPQQVPRVSRAAARQQVVEQPKADFDTQYKIQVGSITEEFMGHMNRALRMTAFCDGKATQESLKLAQESLNQLMSWLPEKSGAYDDQLRVMMTGVHTGFKHFDSELADCLAKAQAAERQDQFVTLGKQIERLNFFRTTMFALLEQWNKPMAEIHIIAHALTNYLHEAEGSLIQNRGTAWYQHAFSWLKYKAREVAPFKRAVGTRVPLEIFGRFGNRENWDLTTEQINVVRAHVERIEKIINALFEQSGLDVSAVASIDPQEREAREIKRSQDNLINYAKTWPWTLFDAEDYFTPILSPDKKSEFAAARHILIECKRALEVPTKAATVRDCLKNIDKSVNVLNSSLMRLKALRTMGKAIRDSEASDVRLTAEERTIISALAEYRRLDANYPIIDDNAWKMVVGAVANGSFAAHGLLDATAEKIGHWNQSLVGLILQAPGNKKLFEKILEYYRLGVTGIEFVQMLNQNLNSLGYQTSDVVAFARGLTNSESQLGKIILWNLEHKPGFQEALDKLKSNQAALNDAADVLYHVLGFFNERGIHLLEIALRWAGPLEQAILGAQAVANYVEGQEFAKYLEGKLTKASGGVGGGLRRVGAALDRTAILTHSRFGLTPRNYAEGLQVVADMSIARTAALPEAVTRVTIQPGSRIRVHTEIPLAAIDRMEDNPQLKFATLAEIEKKKKQQAELHPGFAQGKVEPIAESKISAAQAAEVNARVEVKRRTATVEEGLGLGGLPSNERNLNLDSDVQPRQATPDAEEPMPAIPDVADELRVPEIKAQADAHHAAAEPVLAPQPLDIPALRAQRAQLDQESSALDGSYADKAREKDRIDFELQYILKKNAERETKAASWGRWHYFYRVVNWPYWQRHINKLTNDQLRITTELDGLRNRIEACKQARLNNIKDFNTALTSSATFNNDQLDLYGARAYAARDNKRMADDRGLLDREEARLQDTITNLKNAHAIQWRTWRPTGWFGWAWGKLRFKVSGHHTRQLADLNHLLARVQYRKQLLNTKMKEFRDKLAQVGINLSAPVNLSAPQKQELKDLHPELFSDLV